MAKLSHVELQSTKYWEEKRSREIQQARRNVRKRKRADFLFQGFLLILVAIALGLSLWSGIFSQWDLTAFWERLVG